MIACSKCNVEKEETEFSWRKKDVIRHKRCKSCQAISGNKHYQENKDVMKQKAIAHNIVATQSLYKHISEYKANLGCCNCKENDPACLDLHHLDSETKEGNVSDLVKKGNKNKVLEEIKKCIVICANCHRKHHSGNSNIKLYREEAASCPPGS